jgi:hypothetical protein
MEVIGDLSAWFALINILSIPPLTGVHLLAVAAPVCGKITAKIAPYAGPALAAVAASGVFTNVLGSAYGTLAHSFLNR